MLIKPYVFFYVLLWNRSYGRRLVDAWSTPTFESKTQVVHWCYGLCSKKTLVRATVCQEMRIKPYVFCVCSIDVDHVVDAWSTPIFKMNVIGFLVLEQHVDNTKPLARATCCQDMLITHWFYLLNNVIPRLAVDAGRRLVDAYVLMKFIAFLWVRTFC